MCDYYHYGQYMIKGEYTLILGAYPTYVHIDYFVEKVPLGNAGALFALKEQLEGDFLLLNADAIFDIDFKRFVQYHKEHHGLATLFTHPNSHPYDSGLIVTGSNGTVEQWMTKEESRPLYYKNRVNAGLHVISSELLRTPGTHGTCGIAVR